MIECKDVAEAGDWEVFVVEYARSHKQPMASLVWGTFDEAPVDNPCGFVLARNRDRVVLCDCGFMKERGGGEMARKFDIPDWVSPLRMLQELGIRAEDVTDIVVSHAHFDHMGSVDQFPRAHIYLQKVELLSWIEAMALPPRFGILSDVVNTDDVLYAIAATKENRLSLIEGDRNDVIPGIHVRLAPGHTLGQQFILVDSQKGRYAVAGDCIYSARNLTGEGCGHNHGRYVPLGVGIGSVWDQLKSFDRLERSVAGDRSRIIILHDIQRWSAFERVAEVEGFVICRVA